MTPTIVFNDEKLFLATGGKGGSRIITSVLQVILNVIDHNMSIREAASAPRIHHQWLPDTLYVEKDAGKELETNLRKKGYKVKRTGPIGSTQSIAKIDGFFLGATDPRHPGGLAQGH